MIPLKGVEFFTSPGGPGILAGGHAAETKDGPNVVIFLLKALVVFGLVEAMIMTVFDRLEIPGGWMRTLLDALLLVLFGIPVLYVSVIRDFVRQAAEGEALRRTAREQEATLMEYSEKFHTSELAERLAREETKRLNLLARIATAVLEGSDIRAATAGALEEFARVMDLPRCSVRFFPEGPTVEYRIPGYPTGASLSGSVHCARFPAAEDYAEGRTRVVNDVRECLCHRERSEDLERIRLGAYLGVPIVARGRLFGVLSLDSDVPRRWTSGEVQAAETIARQIGVANRHSGMAREREEIAGRLLSLTNNVPGIVYRGHRDWSVSFIGAEVERLLGFTPDEFYGGSVSWWELICPEDRERVARSFRNAVHEGTKFLRIEYRIRGRDGGVRWIEDRRQMIYDAAGGGISHVDGLLTDITERKNAEEERRRLEEQFLQAQKMEAIGRLAGGVAHDFNNILTAIIGYCDIALARLDPAVPPFHEAEEIRRSGERAAALTRQLLAFGRKQVLQPQILNINHIVANMEGMLSRLIGEDIRLHIAPAADLWNVKADPNQVEQVIMNLAVNARDAMPYGGTLTIGTENAELSGRYAESHYPASPGEYVMLAVSDTGCGMTDEVKARIFEPFYSTKEKGKGTGLGLATVYGIVKQSGGSIWVYSEPGRGATFKIYLPRAMEAPEVRPRGEAAVERRLTGTETLLVAEDDETLRALLETILSDAGYKVLMAGRGTEALETGSRHGDRIHMLLTDVVMPGMSGSELARKFSSIAPGGKVLFMSGYTENAIVHQEVLDPGVPFLQKPFTRESLLRKVREVLDEDGPAG